jgi:hypothetical protein
VSNIRRLGVLGVLGGVTALGGCVNVHTDPIKIEPIHMTLDINLKVDRQLDDFFGDVQKQAQGAPAPAPETAK